MASLAGGIAPERVIPIATDRAVLSTKLALDEVAVADESVPWGVGPTKLLVLQGTGFCNIDCHYCYLPNRSERGEMSVETVDAIIDRLLDEKMLKSSLLVNWHAGEPLVLPTAFYAARIPLFDRLEREGIAVTHSLQTNAMLVSNAYCDLFRRFDIRVGVSVDGPAFIHDAQRVTRTGKGTHAATVAGMRRLQARGIAFNAICVLSDLSVRHPDAVYAFFAESGVRAVAFNIEEIEGANRTSSITDDGYQVRFRQFLEKFWTLVERDGRRIRVREFDDATGRIVDVNPRRNSQTDPFINVTVSWQGDFSTFCPELLGNAAGDYPTFILGNVHRMGFRDSVASPLFRRMYAEIRAGVAACETQCDYFAVCGGGSPSNKIAENGSFNSTATRNCQSRIKTTCDFVLGKVEARMAAGRV